MCLDGSDAIFAVNFTLLFVLHPGCFSEEHLKGSFMASDLAAP